MAKVKFKSEIACLSAAKTNEAYIDSGATHHFFYSRSLFLTYETIHSETVKAAVGSTKLVGKGTVLLPVCGGTIIEAYHAPSFSSHIVSVGTLLKSFEVHFSESMRSVPSCFLMRKGTFDVLWETAKKDGLFPIVMGNTGEKSKRANASVASRPPSSDLIKEWHGKTGHTSVERYIALADIFDDVPHFERSILEKFQCVPCITAKAKRAPLQPSTYRASRPLEHISLDISGPVGASMSGSTYTVAFLDSFTAKSDVFTIRSKAQLPDILQGYKARAENIHQANGYRLSNIRLDRAEENSSGIIKSFCNSFGISLEFSPAYASESNGAAERLVQEHWTRTRVLLFASKLPETLWAEAMHHSNWLRNRLPAKRINGQIPMQLWDPSSRISFKSVPEFGQPGFAFIYYPKTQPRKKLLPRSVFGHFVGMDSDTSLFRVYVPTTKSIIFTRKADFRKSDTDLLPGVSSLVDGIARQRAVEESLGEPSDSEQHIAQAFTAFFQQAPHACLSSKKKRHDPCVPRSFAEACKDPLWRAAIDREYNALINRGTWEYVQRTAGMTPVPFTWQFKQKIIDALKNIILEKARCCLRGDMQLAYVDFDPDFIYAPVAAHESLRMHISFAAANDLVLEGADISNAYLFGNLDVPIIMEQPTDSSGIEARPGQVCRLVKSIYGAKQAGEIWGSLLSTTLLAWGFLESKLDPRVYFTKRGCEFIVIAIVVDDIAFASNSQVFLDTVKSRLSGKFDIKLFGELRTFIGWDITRTPDGIKVDQRSYVKDLLERHGLEGANGVCTPLPTNADVLPAQPHELLLNYLEHGKYRSQVGGLLYLAVCTRLDISVPISVLSRHLHEPTPRHMAQLKRVMRYVAGTPSLGLFYARNGPLHSRSIGACVDADWGDAMRRDGR